MHTQNVWTNRALPKKSEGAVSSVACANGKARCQLSGMSTLPKLTAGARTAAKDTLVSGAPKRTVARASTKGDLWSPKGTREDRLAAAIAENARIAGRLGRGFRVDRHTIVYTPGRKEPAPHVMAKLQAVLEEHTLAGRHYAIEHPKWGRLSVNVDELGLTSRGSVEAERTSETNR